MTVAELIDRLKEFPSDMRVITGVPNDGGYEDMLDDVFVSGPLEEIGGDKCIVIDWRLHGPEAEQERQAEHEAWVNSPEYAAMGDLIAHQRDVSKAKRAARLAAKNQEDHAWSAAIKANRQRLIP